MAFIADSLTVKTEPGKAQGKTINDGKVNAFLGLPYAAPPVGDLRWKAPQPPAKWKANAMRQVRRALRQGRVFDDMIFQDAWPARIAVLNVYAPPTPKTKASCASCSGFTAAATRRRQLGTPSQRRFPAPQGRGPGHHQLPAGVFGFLATEEMAKEANGAAGNYGLLDMVSASNGSRPTSKIWRDPNNVTIFGESAGSAAVSTLMRLCRESLFQKAIGESGGALGEGILGQESLADHTRKDSEWVASLGVKSLQELRAMPTDKVLKPLQNGFGPDIDGRFLTESVADAYAAGRQAHVPCWQVGTPMKAASCRPGNDRRAVQGHGEWPLQRARRRVPYPLSCRYRRPGAALGCGLWSDSFIAFSTWKWIEAHRKTGESPVYRYPLRTGRSAQQISLPAPSPSIPTTSNMSLARSIRAPRDGASRRPQAER